VHVTTSKPEYCVSNVLLMWFLKMYKAQLSDPRKNVGARASRYRLQSV